MKTVNRGSVIVTPAKPMIEWSKQFDELLALDDTSEPTVYLIEDGFMDEEPILKANFKKIFLNELSVISDDESTFPEIKWEVFNEWFVIDTGTAVFDLDTSNIKAD